MQSEGVFLDDLELRARNWVHVPNGHPHIRTPPRCPPRRSTASEGMRFAIQCHLLGRHLMNRKLAGPIEEASPRWSPSGKCVLGGEFADLFRSQAQLLPPAVTSFPFTQRPNLMTKIVLPILRTMIVAPLLYAVAQAAPPNSPMPQMRAYGGNASRDKAPITAITKNIVTDFRAKCDGVSNDAPAFLWFNSWARAQTLPITLTIPPGSICNFASGRNNAFAVGVKNLVVSGYGATMNATFLGGFGVKEDNAHSSRVATTTAGATSVTLLNPRETSRFRVGRWALLSGLDVQGTWSYPPNHAIFEYVLVTGIDAATGQITFSGPISHSYKSTWPHYSGAKYDIGGPATLYALDPSWDTEVEYKGLTISSKLQTYTNGRLAKYTDVTFSDCNGGGGLSPTQNLKMVLTNVTMPCTMEVDKLVSTLNIEGGTFGHLLFYSSSTTLVANNTKIDVLNGTPQKAILSNSTIGLFVAGTLHYGRTTEISCTNCSIGAFKNPPGGSLDSNVDTRYTMSDGVITVPNSHGPLSWAVPGVNAMFALYDGSLLTEGSPFQVIDLTQDATNTYIETSLAGGFPLLPTDPSHGLNIYAHPTPKFTCTNCTGSVDAMDLSQTGAQGQPLFSYSKRTYSGSTQRPPRFTIWGNMVKLSINVMTPYTGIQPTLTLTPLGAGGTAVISSELSTNYNPAINLKIAGDREIFPNSIVGAQSGDSISIPGTIWFEQGIGPYLSADISGEPSSVWPTFTIEVTTDQGVVNP
jgi:hypothetical protein